MNPNTLKEDLSIDLGCDALLVGCENFHLRESINNHEETIITMLG
jgi:hypothetical protein